MAFLPILCGVRKPKFFRETENLSLAHWAIENRTNEKLVHIFSMNGICRARKQSMSKWQIWDAVFKTKANQTICTL